MYTSKDERITKKTRFKKQNCRVVIAVLLTIMIILQFFGSFTLSTVAADETTASVTDASETDETNANVAEIGAVDKKVELQSRTVTMNPMMSPAPILLSSVPQSYSAFAEYTVEFNDTDDSGNDIPWAFNQYDKLSQYRLSLYAKSTDGVYYTVVWADGTVNEGTLGDDGYFSLGSADSAGNSSAVITFYQVDSIDMKYVNAYLRTGDRQRDLFKSGSGDDYSIFKDNNGIGKMTISLYKASAPVEIDIDFLMQSGESWSLNRGTGPKDELPYKFLEVSRSGIYYELVYDNGYTVGRYTNANYDNRIYDSSFDSGTHSDGATSLKVILYECNDDDKISIYTPDEKYFGKLVANGNVYNATDFRGVEAKEYSIKPGTKIQIDAYETEKVSGTVYFDDYDGTFPADYAMNFSLSLIHSSGNMNLNDTYWVYEGSSTKIYYKDQGKIDISIPIGKSVTIYNIPKNAMVSQGAGWPGYSVYDRATYEYGKDITVVTHNDGQSNKANITQNDADQLGISPYLYHTVKTTAATHYLDTSGEFRKFGLEEGFEIRYYIYRKTSQFMFKKSYDASSSYSENDKQHHFRVTLTDPLTGKPLDQDKVAYFIYSSDTDVQDNNKVRYANLNSNGQADIYVRAGETVRIGRAMSKDYFDNLSPVIHLGGGKDDTISSNTMWEYNELYLPEEGMLPYGTEYKIEEVEDGYTSAVASGSASGTVDYKYASSLYSYAVRGRNSEDYYNEIGKAEFVNTRNTGSLKISKTVKGGPTDKSFDFEVKLNDNSTDFPTEYNYEKSDGTKGKITFNKGGTVNRDGMTCTEYTATVSLKDKESITINDIPADAQYSVQEKAESAEGYQVSYTGNEGYILTAGSTCDVVNELGDYTFKKYADVKDEFVEPGQEITYTIEVENTGNTDLEGIWIRDYIPENTHFVSAGEDGERGAIDGKQHVTWFIPTLKNGKTTKVTMTVAVDTCVSNGDKITNAALVDKLDTPDKPSKNRKDTGLTTNRVDHKVKLTTQIDRKKGTTAKTGDATKIGLFVILFIMAAAGIVFILIKKKNLKD